MITKKDYITSNLDSCKAEIIQTGFNEHPWVITDLTIFHPQGGGQKADSGTINGARVIQVKNTEDGIIHFLDCAIDKGIGDLVQMDIDTKIRNYHSALHTAGHLIGVLVEELFPSVKACQAHHWPGEARVEFSGDNLPLVEDVQDKLQVQIAKLQGTKATIKQSLNDENGKSTMTIQGYPSIPCGGTHLRCLSEMNKLHITCVKIKKSKLRISYELDITNACD